MATIVAKRLRKEMLDLKKSRDPHIWLKHQPETFKQWTAVIRGPEGSPFEGGNFVLLISVGDTYPMTPPNITFVTKIFHPNVLFKTGEICLDILKPESWTPAWTLQSVCRAVAALLSHPEADSPLNCDCGNLIRSGDLRGYRSMARMYTALHAAS